MTTPAPQIPIGERIRDRYVVRRKLGEGSCGAVYLVANIAEPAKHAAMKVESKGKCKDDEMLKMEVYVMKRLQNAKHVAKVITSGKYPTYNYIIMTLFGRELGELRRRMPERKMTLSTVLRVGIQCTEALEEIHIAGFVHRDVKPSNFSCGYRRKDFIYIFDFGLCRLIMMPDPKDGGKLKLRDPRPKVSFRGTVRYCSLNVHLYKECGRHDDFWGLVYVLVELLMRTLPWKGLPRKEVAKMKQQISNERLFAGCPPSFAELSDTLKTLTYADTPPYSKFRENLRRDFNKLVVGGKFLDPYDWMKKDFDTKNVGRVKKSDEKAEREDKDTLKEVIDSLDTDISDANTDSKDFSKENTLENVSDVENLENTKVNG